MPLTLVSPTLVERPAPTLAAASADLAGARGSSAVESLLRVTAEPPRVVRATRLLVRLGVGAAISFGAVFALAPHAQLGAGTPIAAALLAFVLTALTLRVGAHRWRRPFGRRSSP